MPIQQVELHSSLQKLSKIETLRLARNHISAMTTTLQEGVPMEMNRFLRILSRDLSQTTANLLTGKLIMGETFPKNFSDYPHHAVCRVAAATHPQSSDWPSYENYWYNFEKRNQDANYWNNDYLKCNYNSNKFYQSYHQGYC